MLVTALTEEGKNIRDGPDVHVWSPSAFLENLGKVNSLLCELLID